MGKISARILTSMKVVRKQDDVFYVRTSAVNKGDSVIKLVPFSETVYVSKQVDLLTGPNTIALQKKTLDELGLGKWHNKVPYFVMLDEIFVNRKEGKHYDR